VQDDMLLRFVTYYHSRSLLSYYRLRLNEPNAGDRRPPLRPGLFKGTYGAHGIELINLVIPEGSSMFNAAGVKVTGDPNVPCGEKSFVVDSIRCLDMSLETQSSMEAIEAFMEDPSFIFPEDEEGDLVEMDFRLPDDCYERESIQLNKCKGRWSCQCQIAQNMHFNPRTIPGNFILFNDDLFAVLFIELRSISLYHRAEEV